MLCCLPTQMVMGFSCAARYRDLVCALELVGHRTCSKSCLLYSLIFRAANATWWHGKFSAKHITAFNLCFGRSTADFRPKHGDTILTNMMSQADSSSSASVPSLKHHITSLRMFQFFQGQIFVEIQRRTGKIGFKHGIYPQFTLEAGRLSSGDFHDMYREKSPRYSLWFSLCLQEIMLRSIKSQTVK